MMEYLPREDGFPSGFALGKTILPRETFHHGIPSGMSYLYNGRLEQLTWDEFEAMFLHDVELEDLATNCSEPDQRAETVIVTRGQRSE